MKKIDLHIHTLNTEQDPDYNYSFDILENYVNNYEIDCIAITNHNIFELGQYKKIRENLNKIKVFPGIEIDLENGHMLVICGLEDSKLELFKSQTLLWQEAYKNRKTDLGTFFEIFNNYKDYLLIPHYEKKPKIENEIISKFNGEIKCGEVSSIKKWYRNMKDSEITPLLFSDVRIGDKEINYAKCTYVEIEDITLENLKIALSDKNKVHINRKKIEDFFEFNKGLNASTKLNLILGKRSSGKTFLLNNLNETFGPKEVKYIEQFKLTKDCSPENFNDYLFSLYGEEIDKELEKWKKSIEKVVNIDLEENFKSIENYLISLKDFAQSKEKDIYSKSKIFTSQEFNYIKNNELTDAYSSLKKLLNNNIFKKEINEDKYITEKINEVFKKFIKLRKEEYKEKFLKDIVDIISKETKKKLEKNSSSSLVKDIELFNIILDTKAKDLLEKKFIDFKNTGILIKKTFQYFDIIIEKESYKNSTEVKKANRVNLKQSIKFEFDQWYKKDFVKYLQEIYKNNNNVSELIYMLVKININVKNKNNICLSGGERVEFRLLNEIEKSKNKSFLLIDEPEASFDNVFIGEKVVELIREISKDTTIFLVTHNSTLSLLLKPNNIIYTDFIDGSFIVYTGMLTAKELKSTSHKRIGTYNVLINMLEGGERPYEEKKDLYKKMKE